MKRIKTTPIIIVLVLLFVMLSACGKGIEQVKEIAKEASNIIEGFKVGEWENQVYTNEKFNLEVSLPQEWYVFSNEELSGVFGDVAEYLKDSDVDMEEGLLVPLYFVINNQDATLATANMSLTAMRSLLSPNFDSDYSEEALQQMAEPMEQYGEVEINKEGETDFAGTKAHLITMKTAVTGTDMIQYQKVYQLYKSGYVLTFTLTALDETTLEEMENYIVIE
jgi:cytochrome P450